MLSRRAKKTNIFIMALQILLLRTLLRRPSVLAFPCRTSTTYRHLQTAFYSARSSNLDTGSLPNVPQIMLQTLQNEILPSVLIREERPHESAGDVTNVEMLLGVSGGCDSVALLHALELCRQHQEDHFPFPREAGSKNESEDGRNKPLLLTVGQKKVACSLHVVHFDHQQRGTESDGDRELVHQLCNEYNIPCQSYFWQDKRNGTTPVASFSQESARNWRRDCMRRQLQTLVADEQSHDSHGLLLTAHHQDDSEETLLLKFLRGAHLTKLTGMPPVVTDATGGASLHWARPFIHLRKQDLIDFLQRHDYAWREDASNHGNKYLRNRVRNELIPLMQELVSSEDALHRRLANIQEQSRELRADVQERAEAYFKEHSIHSGSGVLLRLPKDENGISPVVFKEAVHMWVTLQTTAVNFQFSYDKLRQVCAQLNDYPTNRQWRINIGAGWDILRQGESLSLAKAVGEEAETANQGTLARKPLEYSLMDDGTIDLKIEDSSLRIIAPRHSNLVFYEKSSGECWNERFTPPWRGSPIRLKEFLRGQKVPLHSRRQASIVTLESAEEEEHKVVAVWVETRNRWVVGAGYEI